jgi:predicted ATPase
MPWLIGDDAAALRRSLKAARSERMLREFAALIELLTMDEVLVLALEDLQWSDPSTVDLLSLLGQRSAPARLLVIGSYRPAEIAVQEHVLCHAVRTLQVRRRCAELPIHELDEGGVESYLHARFPGAELPLGLTRALHAHTDGNPLFISAVVEDMLSRGWILDTSPGWCFAIPSRQVELGVPDDVRRVIAAQFERLGPADQGLLQAASVAGAAFAARAIAVPLGWPLDDVETRCETLAQSQRFLRDAGSGPWPDGAVARRYGFVHELYRQVVYEQITAGGRQRLHRQIGEALEAAYGERATEIAGELAAHFERGQDVPRALRYLAAAAARAQLRFARREAATDLETAIVLANLLPDEGERHRRELDLRIALAPILLDVHGFASEVLARNCERAYELCEDVGTPAELFHIAYALGLVYGARGDAHRAPAMFERLDALAHSLGTAEHRLLVDSLMARAATHQGHFAEACRLARGALSIDLRGTPKGGTEFGTDAVVAAQTHCALALWFLGETDRATATMDHALTNAGGSGSVFTLAAALCHSAILALLCRDPAKGRGLAERAAALAAEHDLVYWSSMASALQGWASVQEGNALEAIGKLEAARAAHRSMGVGVFYTLIQAFLAEACLRAGEPEAGLAAVDEGLAVAETTLDRSYRAELYRLKGELLLARAAAGSAPEAEQCLRQALDLARAAEAKALELRAATSLARMLASRGDASVGATLLDTICQWFDTGARSPDLSEARALRKNFA